MAHVYYLPALHTQVRVLAELCSFWSMRRSVSPAGLGCDLSSLWCEDRGPHLAGIPPVLGSMAFLPLYLQSHQWQAESSLSISDLLLGTRGKDGLPGPHSIISHQRSFTSVTPAGLLCHQVMCSQVIFGAGSILLITPGNLNYDFMKNKCILQLSLHKVYYKLRKHWFISLKYTVFREFPKMYYVFDLLKVNQRIFN